MKLTLNRTLIQFKHECNNWRCNMVEPTLFNGEIEFDIETIPKALQEQCLKLEELDRAGDDIS